MNKYFFSSLLILFSGFFLSNYYIDPIYITFVATIIFFIIYTVFREKTLYFSISIIISLIFLGYIYLTQFIMIKSDFNTVTNVIVSIIYLFLTLQLTYNLSTEKLFKVSSNFIFFSILILTIEMFLRLLNPIYEINGRYLAGDTEFYAYKMNSFLYQDSNYVGAYIVALFFFTFYLNSLRSLKIYKISMLILFVLCVFTFSRASILTIVIFFPLFWIYKKVNIIYFFIIFVVISIPSIFFLYDILAVFLSDGSFMSKLGILELMLNHIKNSDLSTLLFGIGFGNSYYYFGIGAHNIVVTYLIESGIFGILLFVTLWVSILIKSNYSAVVIILPILFNGMSLSSHATPYLYTIFAVTLVMSNRHSKKGELL